MPITNRRLRVPHSFFEGMRWYKCDFQMQTPADPRHWRGEPMARTPEGIQLAAMAYARRCYEVGLECICLTEHNFIGSLEFLPALKKSLVMVARELGCEAIILFPGFEMTANVGFGCHVLAIFDPDSNINVIDHKVTECGVPVARQKSSGDNAQSTLPLCSKRNSSRPMVGNGLTNRRTPGDEVTKHVECSNNGLPVQRIYGNHRKATCTLHG